MRLSGAFTLILALALPCLAATAAQAQSTDDEDEVKESARRGDKKARPAKDGKPTKADKATKAGKPTEPSKDAKQPDPTSDDPLGAAAAAPAEEEAAPLYDPSGSELGTSEDPDAPTTEWDKPAVEVKKAAAPVRTGYPIERILRPLVLPRGTIEIGLEVPTTVNPVASASGLLRGAYSINGKAQLGLRYNTFTATEAKSFGGKSFALDFDYLVLPWLAGQLSLPVLADPYAQGLVLGAPMKFSFLGKFSLEFGRDLVGFKIKRFLPSVTDAAANEAFKLLDDTNTVLPDGELNLGGTATYQFKPNLAGDARYNMRLIDFNSDGAPIELTVGGHYSTSARLDVGLRLGFLDLSHYKDSFTAQLIAAFRI